MNSYNRHQSFPIIDYISILTFTDNQIKTFKEHSLTEITQSFPNYQLHSYFKYKSIHSHTTSNQDELLFDSLPLLVFPSGAIELINTVNNIKPIEIITFTKHIDASIKHCSCLIYNEKIKLKDNAYVIIKSSLVLISSYDLYEFHKEIIEYFGDIIINYITTRNGSKINSNSIYNSCYKNENDDVIKSYMLFPLIISFLLNGLVIHKNHFNNKLLNESFLISDLFSYQTSVSLSNMGKYFQFKFHFPIKNTLFKLIEYDLMILLKKIHIDDLIQIYLNMLLEKQIIFIFTNYSEINIIIQSMIQLLYPLDQRKYQSVSYINNSNDKIIRQGTLSIFGIYENDYEKKYKYNINMKESIVYHIEHKQFINLLPFHFPDKQLVNELSSKLHYLIGEKIMIDSEMSFDESQLKEIFNYCTEDILKKMNTNLYFNLQLQRFFFEFFIGVVNPMSRQIKHDNYFYMDLSKKIMYNSYETNLKHNKEYKDNFINHIFAYMKDNPSINYKQFLSKEILLQIKKEIISYYNFTYINVYKLFSDIIKQYPNDVIQFTPSTGHVNSFLALFKFDYDNIKNKVVKMFGNNILMNNNSCCGLKNNNNNNSKKDFAFYKIYSAIERKEIILPSDKEGNKGYIKQSNKRGESAGLTVRRTEHLYTNNSNNNSNIKGRDRSPKRYKENDNDYNKNEKLAELITSVVESEDQQQLQSNTIETSSKVNCFELANGFVKSNNITKSRQNLNRNLLRQEQSILKNKDTIQEKIPSLEGDQIN